MFDAGRSTAEFSQNELSYEIEFSQVLAKVTDSLKIDLVHFVAAGLG